MTPDRLLRHLDELGLRTETRRHEAVFTVAESARLAADLPGAHSKNLFLKDRTGSLFLVVAPSEAAIDLKALAPAMGAAGRVSFGSPDLLRQVLGVEPGSVTPFAAINDCEGRVRVVLDAGLLRHDRLNFHPLDNTMTTAISADDLLLFLRSTGHEPRILDLPSPGGRADCVVPSPVPS